MWRAGEVKGGWFVGICVGLMLDDERTRIKPSRSKGTETED